MTAQTEGRALADAGQQTSLGILLPDDFANFEAVIRSFAVGSRLSINKIRDRLDSLGIPEVSRGALFGRALAAGLIARATVVAGGHEFQITEPSTGRSAHNARVKVYVRTDPDEGR